MSEKPKVVVPTVVKSTAKAVTVADGIGALNQIVEAARECLLVHEQESSKRSRIQAYEVTEVRRIKAAEAILKDYFAQVFAERRHVYQELFSRLDSALESGQNDALNHVLQGIVDVARSSPLADAGDLDKVRAALDDPNQIWNL